MKIIVTTSDNYLHLLPDFADCLVKTGLELYRGFEPVTVLGYKTPVDLLPANFEFVSLGKQPEGRDWTSGLIPYFTGIKHDYFLLLMDDYFMESVDVDRLQHAGLIMECCPNVMKFDLTTDRANFAHFERKDNPNLVESGQGARYRSSLQAAIWRTSYFRKLLVPKRTPWEFELLGENECMFDDATILGTKTGIMKYKNRMLMGNLRYDNITK